jgi:hypothetical protein
MLGLSKAGGHHNKSTKEVSVTVPFLPRSPPAAAAAAATATALRPEEAADAAAAAAAASRSGARQTAPTLDLLPFRAALPDASQEAASREDLQAQRHRESQQDDKEHMQGPQIRSAALASCIEA